MTRCRISFYKRGNMDNPICAFSLRDLLPEVIGVGFSQRDTM